MRIASWHLWWRYGQWWKRREAIVAELRRVRPCICGLERSGEKLAGEFSCTVEVMGS
jgi:hypothetical protein